MHTHRYTLYGDEIEHVFEEKDLGIVIDMEMTFEEHMSLKIKKANAMMGLIRRTFSYFDGDTFKNLYTSFVRPHLEYCMLTLYGHQIYGSTSKCWRMSKFGLPNKLTG